MTTFTQKCLDMFDFLEMDPDLVVQYKLASSISDHTPLV